MDTVFESKRDAWIVVLIWAGALICGYGAALQLSMALSALGAFMLILYAVAAAFMLADPDIADAEGRLPARAECALPATEGGRRRPDPGRGLSRWPAPC